MFGLVKSREKNVNPYYFLIAAVLSWDEGTRIQIELFEIKFYIKQITEIDF